MALTTVTFSDLLCFLVVTIIIVITIIIIINITEFGCFLMHSFFTHNVSFQTRNTECHTNEAFGVRGSTRFKSRHTDTLP